MRRFFQTIALLLALLLPVQIWAATFVNGNGADDATNDTTMAVTVTGVSAGNLVHVIVKYEGTGTTATVSDGTTSLTQDATGVQSHTNGDLNAVNFYLLSSVASGSVTYTVTLGASRPFKTMDAAVFSYSGTASRQTAAYGSLSATDNGTDPVLSGTISPTGSDLIVVGSYFAYASATSTTHLINAVAADATFGGPGGSIGWYRLLGTGFTNGAASIDFNSTNDGLVSITAYSITAGGGGPDVTPFYRRRAM